MLLLQSIEILTVRGISIPLTFPRSEEQYWTAETRTTTGIAFSCVFTFLACAWCCARPNIPSPYDSKLHVLFAKLNILFWILVTPELVACWTFRQWFEAGKILEEFRGRGWTRHHALFLMMGGFVLSKDGMPMQTVSPQIFRRLVGQNVIEFPSIAAIEIQGSSNLHPILAGLVLLQAIWFAVQCLSRAITGLVITPLEATTACLVLSTAIIFTFVRQKPLDIRHPVFIPITPQFNVDRLIYDAADRGLVFDDFKREKRKLRIIKQIAVVEQRPLYQGFMTSFMKRCFRWLVIWPLMTVYGDFGDLAVNLHSTELGPGDLKVPLFYLPDSSDALFSLILPITCILGAGIGVVHCLFWSWRYFPSRYAEFLWRLYSEITAGFYAICLVITLITSMFPLFNRLPRHRILDMISQAFAIASVLFLSISLIPFVVARIGLIVESFRCLILLPNEALEIVTWTRFIPHFC